MCHNDVTIDKVVSGTDIFLFTACVIMAAVFLYTVPFCVHMIVCRDVYSTKSSTCDSSRVCVDRDKVCGAMGTGFRLDPQRSLMLPCRHL